MEIFKLTQKERECYSKYHIPTFLLEYFKENSTCHIVSPINALIHSSNIDTLKNYNHHAIHPNFMIVSNMSFQLVGWIRIWMRPKHWISFSFKSLIVWVSSIISVLNMLEKSSLLSYNMPHIINLADSSSKYNLPCFASPPPHISCTLVVRFRTVILGLDYTLESIGGLLKIPMPRSHSRPIKSESWSGTRGLVFLNCSRWFQWASKVKQHCLLGWHQQPLQTCKMQILRAWHRPTESEMLEARPSNLF